MLLLNTRIFFRVLILSSILNFTMMICAVVTALIKNENDYNDYSFPYVSGTVFQKAGVWVMPLITIIMYFVKIVSLKVLLQDEDIKPGANRDSNKSKKDRIEELKSVTFRRSYLFGNGVGNESDSNVVMTSNPLSVYESKNALVETAADDFL